MSQYSETIGSFVRTGPYPLEADLVFESYDKLQEWATNNKSILYEGLYKIVIEDDQQKLFWVVKDSDNLVFKQFDVNPALDKDVTVTNVTVGNLKNGDILYKGTSFTDLIIRMLISPKKPTYTITNISGLSSPVEVGTVVNNAIGTYTQNQGGSILTSNASITGFIDASSVITSNTGNTVNINFTGRVGEGNNTVTSTVTYDNSTLFPEITGDSISTSKTIIGVRKYFRGNGIAPSNNSGIRAGVGSLSSNLITYSLNIGSTDMWIAIPSNKRLSEVRDTSALNAIITSNFVKVTTLSIDGATEGKDAINYDIYQITGYGPFSNEHNITFTIS